MIPILNLLDDRQKRRIRSVRFLLLVHEILLLIFIVTVFGSGLIFAARIMLEQKFYEVVTTQVPHSPKIAALNRDIRYVNQQTEQLTQLTPHFNYWSPVIVELVRKSNADVTWELLILNRENLTIRLQGTAKTRASLSEFKKQLETSSKFITVDLPLQYLATEEDLTFVLTIAVREEVVKTPLTL